VGIEPGRRGWRPHQNLVKLFATIAEIVEQRAAEHGPELLGPLDAGAAAQRHRRARPGAGHGLLGADRPHDRDRTAIIADVKDPSGGRPRSARNSSRDSKAVAKSPETAHDYDLAVTYWLRTFSAHGRSDAVIDHRNLLQHGRCPDPGLAYRLLGTETELVPDITFRNGKVIVLDLPVLEYGDAGRVIQGIWKYCFQKAVERRDVTR